MTDKEAAARDWLNRNEPRRDEIRSLELQLEEMRDRVNKSVGVPKDVVVQTQPRNNQDERIAEIVDFEKKIIEKRHHFELLEQVTKDTIERMNNPTMRMILIYRYLYRRSWRYIAEKMHYKEGYIFELHVKALNAIYPLIDWSAD